MTAQDNEESRIARRRVLDALPPAFRSVGARLWVGGYMIGSDRVTGASPFGYGTDAAVGLGIVVQVAGELTGGALLLLDNRNEYAAAALLRQLVEVEYLAWAFAEDEDEATSWLRSSQGERLNRWQPRHMRERSNGRFRGADYSMHCELGGHPTPASARLLPRHSSGLPDWWAFYELAAHGASIFAYVQAAVARLAIKAFAETEEAAALASAIDAWRGNDILREQAKQLRAANDPALIEPP